MSYAETIQANTARYPFDKWKTYFEDGAAEAFIPENCEAVRLALDTLLADLTRAGETAPDAAKVALFRTAVEAINAINERTDMIETVEREELCALFDAIAVSAGLNPEDFAEGEGIASEWRDW